MFKSIGKSSNGNTKRHVTSLDKGSRPSIEEDYGDNNEPEERKDPAYWKVKLPSNDLDELMWGSSGKPPPAAARVESPSKFQKKWATTAAADHTDTDNSNSEATSENNASSKSSDECRGETDAENNENDNILSALDLEDHTIEAHGNIDEEPPDKIILEDIVWKQRSGFGKYSFGILQHEWEQRRVVLFESGMLRYYTLKKSMEGVKYDPSHATNPDKSPWVYDPEQEPRGEMDLRSIRQNQKTKKKDGSSDNSLDGSGNNGNGNGNGGDNGKDSSSTLHSPSSSFGEGMRKLKSFGHTGKGLNVGGVKVQARERQSDPGPTPFEIDITRRDNKEMWRFCFQSQSIQIEWLSMLKSIASNDNDDDGDDSDSDDGKDGLADHGFRAGDHIIRWEMLPIVYPIQIHGIVLEAGKNCVIIADFGLASYNNHHQKLKGDPELTTWSEDEGKDDSHDVIMAAWEKYKPREKKRLNVIVVTDPKEVRKWSKINYGDQVEKEKKKEKKPGFFTSLLPWEQKKEKKAEDDEGGDEKDEGGASAENVDADADEVGTATVEGNGRLKQNNDSAEASLENNESNSDDDDDHADDDYESTRIEGEPEWLQAGYRPRKRTGSTSSTVPLNDSGQSVFSIDHPEEKHKAKSELPKSDSAKLVLARTHFILENEDLLPPYHVFYSNSECIAVWCKTGRWSTLQAAVYLVSSSVGFGKSAVMTTISIAAAHLILVPALAVGGLAVVGAPLLYLKRSQDKWDKATMRLTDEFWARAKPDVFVEAIEYWANMGKS